MRIGVVTCTDLYEPDFDEPLLMSALAEAGIDATLLEWDQPHDFNSFDALLLRSCWNYFEFIDRFREWVRLVGPKLINSQAIVEWNLDKRYLLDLAERGIPVVPTTFLTEPKPLPDYKCVIKPTISAGSWQTRVCQPGDPEAQGFLAEILKDRPAMIQPYLTSVEREGEISLVWIDGAVRHAIRKAPRFDGQDESVSAVAIPAGHLELANAVMQHFSDVLYARIDLMRLNEGSLAVSELELIEPSLFFFVVPESLPIFVRAIERLLRERFEATV